MCRGLCVCSVCSEAGSVRRKDYPTPSTSHLDLGFLYSFCSSSFMLKIILSKEKCITWKAAQQFITCRVVQPVCERNMITQNDAWWMCSKATQTKLNSGASSGVTERLLCEKLKNSVLFLPQGWIQRRRHSICQKVAEEWHGTEVQLIQADVEWHSHLAQWIQTLTPWGKKTR